MLLTCLIPCCKRKECINEQTHIISQSPSGSLRSASHLLLQYWYYSYQSAHSNDWLVAAVIAHSLSTEKLRSWKQSCLPQCSWTGSGAVWFILLLYKVSGYYLIEYKDWKTVFLRCFQAPDIVQLPSHEGMGQVFRPCRWTEVSSALLLQAQEEEAVKQQLVKMIPQE